MTFGFAPFHHSDHAVRGPQIDPDNLFSSSHVNALCLVLLGVVLLVY